MTARLDVWPPLPPRVHFRRAARQLPFPLREPGCRLYARARHGLWHGLRALGLATGDEVLVPAYHHGSEVEASVRAGLVPRFYEAREDLAPDPEELERLRGPRTRALHLTHYLGFPQDGARWRAWCDRSGLLLVEDAAQAWLARGEDGRPVGTAGHLAVFCLYKTYGLPDGAAAVCATSLPEPDSAESLGAAATARRHAAWAAERSPAAAALAARLRGAPRPYDAAADFALGSPSQPASPAARFLLPRVAAEPAAEQRRANYRRLLADLGDRVPAPFDRLPDGASPFALPFEVPDKAAALSRLAAAGVAALDFWSVAHPALPANAYPAAARRRNATLGLPVHHELREEDLARIARAALAEPRAGGV
jgi:dTDP-4-amino-4,6-dideoxygalactose transaminase